MEKNQILYCLYQLRIFVRYKNSNKNNKNHTILFVGGNFYANVHGIECHKNVLPKISFKLIVIGHNLMT